MNAPCYRIDETLRIVCLNIWLTENSSKSHAEIDLVKSTNINF